ncbi:MAG: type II toxin-antitoxin system VapC family toxin [Sulfurospirillum sp.]|nr:type II toxin-antitoxin system VapC family toxin [Sulfurospirillum sp.]
MNRYIIDTHIFLWLLFDPEKIDKSKLETLQNPKNKVYTTSISFWEISLKYGLGKLELNGIGPEALPEKAQKMGVDILEIDAATMSSFYKLPKVEVHKDPFDRIIIWKCINDNLTLVSQDRKFPEYEKLGLKFI